MKVSFLSTLKENLNLWILSISSMSHSTGNRNSDNHAEIKNAGMAAEDRWVPNEPL